MRLEGLPVLKRVDAVAAVNHVRCELLGVGDKGSNLRLRHRLQQHPADAPCRHVGMPVSTRDHLLRRSGQLSHDRAVELVGQCHVVLGVHLVVVVCVVVVVATC